MGLLVVRKWHFCQRISKLASKISKFQEVTSNWLWRIKDIRVHQGYWGASRPLGSIKAIGAHQGHWVVSMTPGHIKDIRAHQVHWGASSTSGCFMDIGAHQGHCTVSLNWIWEKNVSNVWPIFLDSISDDNSKMVCLKILALGISELTLINGPKKR